MSCSTSSIPATQNSPLEPGQGGPQMTIAGRPFLFFGSGVYPDDFPGTPGPPEAGHRPHLDRLRRRPGRGPQAGAPLEGGRHRTLRRRHNLHLPPGRRGAGRPGHHYGRRFPGVLVEALIHAPPEDAPPAGVLRVPRRLPRLPEAVQGGQRAVLERAGPPPGDQPAHHPALDQARGPTLRSLPAGPSRTWPRNWGLSHLLPKAIARHREQAAGNRPSARPFFPSVPTPPTILPANEGDFGFAPL